MEWTRREILQAGLSACTLLALPPWMRRELINPPSRLLCLYLDGGASSIDTFDAKPWAPEWVTGRIKARRASNGVWISEHLKGFARLAHRFAFFRNLTTSEPHHERARNLFLFGKAFPEKDCSSLPAAFAREKSRQGLLPLVVEIGTDKTYLSAEDGSDVIHLHGKDLPGLFLRNDVALRVASVEKAALKRAFESQSLWRVRTSSGSSPHPFLQHCEFAIRLLEVGVPSILLVHRGWDTHWGVAERLVKGQLPLLDEGLVLLTEGLSQTGLWKETLLVCVTEFGRTPLLNYRCPPGRDHWIYAFSALLGGGKIPEGVVVGETDELGFSVIGETLRMTDFRDLLLQISGIGGDNVNSMRMVENLTRGNRGT